MARITFADKEALMEQSDIAEINKVTASNINEIKTAINNLDNDFLPLSGGTLTGNLNFGHTSNTTNGLVTWNSGTYQQRLQVIDSSSDSAKTFSFQKSSDSGSTWNNLLTISNTGIVTANTFVGTLNGAATSATKAEQDGNGKVISSTYLPLTGGAISGELTIGGIKASPISRYYFNIHNQYYCFGTITMSQAGGYALIDVYTGVGYDGDVNQECNFSIHLRTGNGGASSYAGHVEDKSYSISCPDIQVIKNSDTSFTIWMTPISYTGQSFFTVQCSNNASFTYAGTVTSTNPAGVLLPVKEYGTDGFTEHTTIDGGTF